MKPSLQHRFVSIVRIFLILLLFCWLDPALPINGQTIPGTLNITEGHPRVYVTADDVVAIKNKINTAPFNAHWNTIKNQTTHGTTDSYKPLTWCKAFRYLIEKDKNIGREAVQEGLSFLKLIKDTDYDDTRLRRPDSIYHMAVCIYDWCYDLLDEPASAASTYKQEYLEQLKRMAVLVDWQSSHDSFVYGHMAEGFLLTGKLPAGVAVYDEDNGSMLNQAYDTFKKELLPVYDFTYPAHMHHQGDSYMGSRFICDVMAAWLFRKIGYPAIFSPEQQYVPYQLIYQLGPDRMQLRSGDGFDWQGISVPKIQAAYLTGAYYQDPYLLNLARELESVQSSGPFAAIFYLLTVPAGMAEEPFQDHLPYSKYFPSPAGAMEARTGWHFLNQPADQSEDAIIFMNIGEYHFAGHQRKDTGIFQIYYKGALAITSGFYGLYDTDHHFWSYHHQTISHNGLLIFDPDEKIEYRKAPYPPGAYNDGGQRYIRKGYSPIRLDDLRKYHKVAFVLAYEIDATPLPALPAHSYISGDITPAYTSKVGKVTRSMAALPTGDNAYPMVFMVFDRVNSTNPDFKKTWLMHSLLEPQISGRRMTIVNDQARYSRSNPNYGYPDPAKGYYRGKLVADCLLPENAMIAAIGGPGKEFWLEGIGNLYPSSASIAQYGSEMIPGFEAGAWRLEVSTQGARDHRFLHAMAVMDKDTPVPPASKLIKGINFQGAELLGKAVLFGQSGEPQTLLTWDAGADSRDVLIGDLQPGTWNVRQNGSAVKQYTVGTQGKCLYLKKCSGKIELIIAGFQPSAPMVQAEPAVNITQTSAILRGAVHPMKSGTTYYFESGLFP